MSPVTPKDQADSEEWARRRKSNVQLGWAFAGLAVVLFVIALFKYRPL
jgi:hypothetical protein